MSNTYSMMNMIKSDFEYFSRYRIRLSIFEREQFICKNIQKYITTKEV